MTTSTRTSTSALRTILPAAFAVAALAILTSRAHAADLDEVTIAAPAVKTIGANAAGVPIREATVQARIAVDPVTLTTNSGVALLNDAVADAARKACDAADPLTQDDGTCFRDAVDSAKVQVDALIARARSNAES